jgi:cytosine/adenosine deaminase-related metal-dependent hydrolase
MRFVTGTQVFSGNTFLKENDVLVLNKEGKIEDLIPATSLERGNIEYYDGIITPGFINTHCHLELSHLKGKIPQHTGIVDFGLSVMKHRNDTSPEEQLEHMQQADKDMATQGIVAVGDISNTTLSARIKQQSGLYYHSFVELIALNPERAGLVFDTGKTMLDEFLKAELSASLAPHAPYSCSKELIRLITDLCFSQNRPTSIHNQESKAENEFFFRKMGNYLRLYDTLSLDIDWFTASGKSSLQTVLESFNNRVKTLLVHNTFSNKEDVVAAQNAFSGLYWCLCPNANLYIENSLPDTELLVSQRCKLTLGTDSLASNSALSTMNEVMSLTKHKPHMPLELILEAATINGARFLDIENRFGSLEKGKTPGINVVDPVKGNVKKLA